MTHTLRYFLVVLLMLALPSVSTAATTCRSGEAAARGGQVGYERDTKAAEDNATKAATWADVLSKCVGGVTGILGGGGFPSIDDELNKLKDRICRAARAEIGKATGKVNDVLGDVSYGTVGVGHTAPGGQASDDFWSSVWR
ncbi:hypothetical protein [Achromobacter insuavis]|uniref:hypothetical protein n=1 Tax=Achromobacter insuavis TaxID=1287735 RepID=UPI001F148216|nr:hypothetical protein [Achromobacter insuavis]